MFVGLLKNESSLTWHLVYKHLIVLVRKAFLSFTISWTMFSSFPSPIGCDPYEMIQGWTLGFLFSSFSYGILKEYGIQLIFEPQWRLAVWFSFQHNRSWILKLLKYAAVCAFLQVLQLLQKQNRNSLSSEQNAFFLRKCFTVQVSWTGGDGVHQLGTADHDAGSWLWCWHWEQHSDLPKRRCLGSSFILLCRMGARVWKSLDSFLSKGTVVTNTQAFAKGLCALFGW